MSILNNNLIKRLYSKLLNEPFNLTYSQCGEDVIIKFLFEARKIEKITYLEIGTNHPVKFNNTFLFYTLGHSGLCIEPDPHLFKRLIKKRSRDKCLNIGIGPKEDVLDFYILNEPLLNTFSKNEAYRVINTFGYKLEEIIKVPLKNINWVIKTYFDKCPNFISIDVEGLDFEILSSFDFQEYRPAVFCIETISFTNNATSEKKLEIFDIMLKNNYKVFADTYVNTIFIDSML